MINLKNYKNEILTGLLSGSLMGLSRCPLYLNFVVFFSLIPLFYYFDKNEKHSIKNTLFLAFSYTFSFNLIALHWISLVTLPGYLGMFILFSIYFLILFFFIGLLTKNEKKILFPSILLIWLCFEYLSHFGEFRFPWFHISYALSEYNILIQLADVGGVYLLSALIIVINYLFYKIFKLRNHKLAKKQYLILVIIVIFWFLYGIIRINTITLKKEPLNIGIVQTSIKQEKKWERSFLDSTFTLYKNGTKEAAQKGADLVIWPESAMPFNLLHHYSLRKKVIRIVKQEKVDLFTGFPDFQKADSSFINPNKFYNACSSISQKGIVDKPYYKNILVPFGERTPFLDVFPFLWKVQMGQANFEYGDSLEYFQIGEFSYSPLICFEIAFAEITNKMARNNVDFIVNLTNDAWFKKSMGSYQHGLITKFRAVESRKTIFRAANTGISMIVSPLGTVLDEIPIFKREVIVSPLITAKSSSLYAIKISGFIPYILFSLLLLLFIYCKRKILFRNL